MSKRIETGLLLDYYGALLNKTQYDVAEMYYNQDMSLSEISEIMGITRQGIHDSVKRTEALLLRFEDKLKMKHNYERVRSLAFDILSVINGLRIKDCGELLQISNLVNKIIERSED